MNFKISIITYSILLRVTKIEDKEAEDDWRIKKANHHQRKEVKSAVNVNNVYGFKSLCSISHFIADARLLSESLA